MHRSDFLPGHAQWVRFRAGTNAGRVVRAVLSGDSPVVTTFGRADEFDESFPLDPTDRRVIEAAGYRSVGLSRYRVNTTRLLPATQPPGAISLLRLDSAARDPLIATPPEPGIVRWVRATRDNFVGRVPNGPLRAIQRSGNDGGRPTLVWPSDQSMLGHSCGNDAVMERVLRGHGYDPVRMRYWVCSLHHVTEEVTDQEQITQTQVLHPMPHLTQPNEPNEVEDPAPSPEAVVDQHERDIATIGRILMAQAERRSWCSEYDEVINQINREISVPLPLRNQHYTVSYTLPTVHTLVRRFSTHPTHAEAQRYLPPGAVISAIHPGGEDEPF